MKKLTVLVVMVLVAMAASPQAMATSKKRTMMPIAPLMIEHRTIDRMIVVIDRERAAIQKDKRVDSAFVDAVVDFIVTYVDKIHHVKEESILFKAVGEKDITPEERATMKALIKEHRDAITIIQNLQAVNRRYREGNVDADIHILLGNITDLYKKHIVTEDKHFFLSVMKYFTQEERDALLQKEWDYDRIMIHEKYRDVVTQLGERQ